MAGAGAFFCLVVVASTRPEAWLVPDRRIPVVSMVPVRLASWYGRDATPPAVFPDPTPVRPGELCRVYERVSGERVVVYVGAVGERTGSGAVVRHWTDEFDANAVRTTLTLVGSEILHVNRFAVRRGQQETQVFYWYCLDGWPVGDRVTANAYALWRRLTRRASPLVIALVHGPYGVSDGAIGRRVIATFAREALPVLSDVLKKPDNAAVRP